MRNIPRVEDTNFLTKSLEFFYTHHLFGIKTSVDMLEIKFKDRELAVLKTD